MKQLLVLVFAVVTAMSAQAQDIGFIGGISNNSADIDNADVNAELGYRLGVAVSLDLVENLDFRTGLMYTNRTFNVTETATSTDFDAELTYFDIPALFQFQFNDIVGIYAGPIVAINMGEKADGQILGFNYSGDISDAPVVGMGKVKSLYLLLQIGANFNFDGIGFDVYYERGLGEIWKGGAENYSNIGANFVYWF